MSIPADAAMLLSFIVGDVLLATGIVGLIKRRPFTADLRRYPLMFGFLCGAFALMSCFKGWKAQRPDDLAWANAIISIVMFAASRALGRPLVVHLPPNLLFMQATGVPAESLRPKVAEVGDDPGMKIVPTPMLRRHIWPGLARITAVPQQTTDRSQQKSLDRLLSSLPRGTGTKYVMLDLCVGLVFLGGALLRLLG